MLFRSRIVISGKLPLFPPSSILILLTPIPPIEFPNKLNPSLLLLGGVITFFPLSAALSLSNPSRSGTENESTAGPASESVSSALAALAVRVLGREESAERDPLKKRATRGRAIPKPSPVHPG